LRPPRPRRPLRLLRPPRLRPPRLLRPRPRRPPRASRPDAGPSAFDGGGGAIKSAPAVHL
ncbi:hypothetical protein GT346_25910, partial [Streptomyces sp. SID161]|nr:hypothetical protein [Streptomyces sp. SID161]